MKRDKDKNLMNFFISSTSLKFLKTLVIQNSLPRNWNLLSMKKIHYCEKSRHLPGGLKCKLIWIKPYLFEDFHEYIQLLFCFNWRCFSKNKAKDQFSHNESVNLK